jgi:hypothetical protein
LFFDILRQTDIIFLGEIVRRFTENVYLCTVKLKTTKKMEARTIKRRRTAHPMSYYREMVQDMDDSQKLELVSILIESVKPAVTKAKDTDDEEYSLRPFTMEELNARIDQAEAEIAAGLGTPHEEVMREWDEEIERWEQEELEMAEAI